MKTQQAIVSDSGLEAQVCNPHDNLFTGGAYNSGHSKEYWDFNKSNPQLPLTKEHTPCAKVTVREVWQFNHKGIWVEDSTGIDKFKGDFENYKAHMNSFAETRIAFEVVSEEESNHIAGVGKKVSVEEAAEKSLEQTLKEHGIYEYDTRIVSAIHNHIIQSGEYVSMKNVEQALRKSLYGYADNYIDSIVISAMQILTILKNKQ